MGLRFLIIYFHIVSCVSDKSFIATFQDGINNPDLHVNYHFLKYTEPIPRFSNFTACHWMYIKYFSKDLMPIWSYCMLQKGDVDDLECLQLSFIPTRSSLNRNLKTEGFLPWSRAPGSFHRPIEIDIQPFKHRTWNHICWTYSSATGCHEIYYNGARMNPVCTGIQGARSAIEGSSDVANLSLIHI